jgi:hypothetical protein
MRGVSAPNRRISAPRRGPVRLITRPARTRSTAPVVRVAEPAGRGAEPVGPHAVELAGLLHELSVRLLTADGFSAALDRLAAFAAGMLPGVVRGSVVLIGEGGPLSTAGHGTAGEAHDELQYATGSGPGLEAARTRSLVTVPDVTALPESDGFGSVVAIPLDVQRAEVGALSLYLERPGAPSPDLLLTAMALVNQAEVLLGELRRRDGLSAGATVDRAVGVIIAQRGCGVHEAYDVLRDTAQRLGLDRQAVAERLIAAVARKS